MIFNIDIEPTFDPKITIVNMIVQSNDAYSLFSSYSLTDGSGDINELSHFSEVFDNGSEENTEPGSGFEGGQPDPAYGADNLENGEATEPKDIVVAHPQFTSPVLRVLTRRLQ